MNTAPSKPHTTTPTAFSNVVTEITAVLTHAARHTAAHEQRMDAEVATVPATLPCDTHPDAARTLDREETSWASWRNQGRFTPVYAACPKCERAARDAARRRYWTGRGVPATLADETLDTFTPDGDPARVEALRTCRAFTAGRRGFLLILGTPGTGKTHLAVGVAKAIGGGLLTTHPDLLTDLRATYKTGGTDKFLDRLQTASCLILDDFGISSGGADEGPVLYQVLAARHGDGLPTVLTSNEELATVKDALGYRLCDRVAEDFQLVTLAGASHRRTHRR